MTIKIVKGEDKEITVQVTTKRSDCSAAEPYSASGVDSATAIFQADDDTALNITDVEVVSADLGKFLITMTDTETALLKAGDQQSFELAFDKGSERKIVQFDSVLEVVERLFT